MGITAPSVIYLLFISNIICFSLAVIGILNDDGAMIINNNLHKMLFSVQLSICMISGFIFFITKLKSNKKHKKIQAESIHKSLLLNDSLELKEYTNRLSRSRTRTDSDATFVYKQFYSFQMDKNMVIIFDDLRKIFNGMLVQVDSNIESESSLDGFVSVGLLFNCFMKMKLRIIILRNFINGALDSNTCNGKEIWQNIELDEYYPIDDSK
jgi:hypothetical protein